jgi:hypothetical protein
MTGIEHTILATSFLAAFFYVGKWVGKKEKVEDIIEHTLNMLNGNNGVKNEKNFNDNWNGSCFYICNGRIGARF